MLYIPPEIQSVLSEMMPLLDWRLWGGPVFFVLLGLGIGLLVEKILLGAVRRIMNQASRDLNENLASLMKGVIRWVFGLWGAYAATFSMGFLNAGSLDMIRRLVFVVAMFIAIRLLARMSVVLVRFYLNHTQALKALPNTSIFENIVRLVVYIFGAIMLLQTLGVSVMPLITALGVGGLAISLALQDTLANMFAGIQMILARQIKVGDFIKLESGFEGTIEDIGWRNTVIRQLSNNLVLVPNSKMSSSILTNFTLPMPEMSTLVEVSVAYDSDLARVEKVVAEVAANVLKSVDGGVVNFEPFIRYHTFGDSGINFNVILRVKTLVDQYLIKHEFVKALHARFNEEGIEIPFPQRVIRMEPEIRSVVLGLTQESQSVPRAQSG